MIERDIELGDAHVHACSHAYRLPVEKRERMDKEVENLLTHGLAEPSCSGLASPCLLVDKVGGSDRFCTDFRKVNA